MYLFIRTEKRCILLREFECQRLFGAFLRMRYSNGWTCGSNLIECHDDAVVTYRCRYTTRRRPSSRCTAGSGSSRRRNRRGNCRRWRHRRADRCRVCCVTKQNNVVLLVVNSFRYVTYTCITKLMKNQLQQNYTAFDVLLTKIYRKIFKLAD